MLADNSGTLHCGTNRFHVIMFSVEMFVECVVMVRNVVVWVCGKSSFDICLQL